MKAKRKPCVVNDMELPKLGTKERNFVDFLVDTQDEYLNTIDKQEDTIARLRAKLRAYRDAGCCPPGVECLHTIDASPCDPYSELCRRCHKNWAARKGEG